MKCDLSKLTSLIVSDIEDFVVERRVNGVEMDCERLIDNLEDLIDEACRQLHALANVAVEFPRLHRKYAVGLGDFRAMEKQLVRTLELLNDEPVLRRAVRSAIHRLREYSSVSP